jgi:hypothetical protein
VLETCLIACTYAPNVGKDIADAGDLGP